MLSATFGGSRKCLFSGAGDPIPGDRVDGLAAGGVGIAAIDVRSRFGAGVALLGGLPGPRFSPARA